MNCNHAGCGLAGCGLWLLASPQSRRVRRVSAEIGTSAELGVLCGFAVNAIEVTPAQPGTRNP